MARCPPYRGVTCHATRGRAGAGGPKRKRALPSALPARALRRPTLEGVQQPAQITLGAAARRDARRGPDGLELVGDLVAVLAPADSPRWVERDAHHRAAALP